MNTIVPVSLRLPALALILSSACAWAGQSGDAKPLTTGDVIAAAKPSDWHRLDPENTLYMRLATGRVVIELAPTFAPKSVANIKLLVREKYFDGLDIVRVQDNYVVQWADPAAEGEKGVPRRSLGKAAKSIKAEFTVPMNRALPFVTLPDRDGYAPQTGFHGDFPAARDPKKKIAWLAHCYGAVGVGRDNDVDSGNGAELYAVIASSARWLDRNITLVGRVVYGMPLLSSLPRGSGPLGFYTKPSQYVRIRSVRIAADLPKSRRIALEIMRTDTPTFTRLVESRRNRGGSWYKVPAGHIDVCSVPIPVRKVGKPPH